MGLTDAEDCINKLTEISRLEQRPCLSEQGV